MIRNLAAFQRRRVEEERRALASMDLAESAALAEALLTSSILEASEPAPRPRARSLARALGITSGLRVSTRT
ncbi:MAG TPA: hypothetical protein VHE35_26415 [Kofleriaceae bacterium]|nr:hypothetical protein [Kofleriaceae bacterium]